MTLIESKFKKIILETFDRLCGELSSDDPPAEIAKAFLAFLDRGGQKVLVHHRNSKRLFKASYFDVWYKSLGFARSAQYERYAKFFLTSAEGRLLLPHLDDLRIAADQIGIQWERAEVLLREILRNREEGLRTREASANVERGTVRFSSIVGERDSNVAQRRTVLRNLMRSRTLLHASDICKEWDDQQIPVVQTWQPDISKWQQALKKSPARVYKLISVDKKKITQRS